MSKLLSEALDNFGIPMAVHRGSSGETEMDTPIGEDGLDEKSHPESLLPKDSELREFYYMADRKSNEEQWREDAKEEFEAVDDETIDDCIERLFNDANWDYEEVQEELAKATPEKQREMRLDHFTDQYIRDREENEDISRVYFENPRILKNATLYRFTPAKPEEVKANGFRGYGPKRLGLTHHETPGTGDLSFAFEKKDLKGMKAVKEMASKYGGNLFEFKVPYAIKAYHNTDYEDQVVFDVNTVKNLKFIGKIGGPEIESFLGESEDLAEKIVYHGSRNSFDKFSLDYAGSDQGVNIAWGLYFSEVPKGAEFYRKLGKGNGKLYKVKIPDGPYIEWNKTVAAQSPRVRAILRKTKNWADANERAKTGKFLSGDMLKGSEFYHGTAHYQNMTDQEVSEWLYSLGIKGVRYKHDDYYNIVLFNADDAKIVGEVDNDVKAEARDDWKKQGYEIGHVKHGNAIKVFARDNAGNKVGSVSVYPTEDDTSLIANDLMVKPEHRRKGIATAMYQYAEKVMGKRFQNEPEAGRGRTPAGQAFWNQPNRPFGEELEHWDNGIWVHYSKHPGLKIHPQQLHHDPAGIYLFPEKFKPEGGWYQYPYKFIVKVNAQNILDLAKLKEEDSVKIYEALVPADKRGLTRADFRRTNHADILWSGLQDYFVNANGPGVGAWNKAFRDLGYDAIFDDTGSIFTNEVQMIVLDPKKVKVIERITQNESGFEEVKLVAGKLAEMLKPYGEVTVSKPKKNRPRYGGARSTIDCTVRVENGDKYLTWDVGTRFHQKDDAVPTTISVHLSGGAYELRQNRSIGTSFEWKKQPWDFKDLEHEVEIAAKAEFGKNESVSEQEMLTDSTRQYFGNAGAGGLFYAESTGRFLVAHRSAEVNEPNTWGTWGGAIEKGESPEEALEREIREETGYTGDYELRHVFDYRDGKFVFHNYLIVVPDEFEPRHSWETQGHAWVALDEVPTPMHYGLIEFLKNYHPSYKESVDGLHLDKYGMPNFETIGGEPPAPEEEDLGETLLIDDFKKKKSVEFSKPEKADGQDGYQITATVNGKEAGKVIYDQEYCEDDYGPFMPYKDEPFYDEINGNEVVIGIQHLEVEPEFRERGIAAELMKLAMADIKKRYKGLPVYINASPMGDALVLDDLVAFYKRYGFQVLKKYPAHRNALLWKNAI